MKRLLLLGVAAFLLALVIVLPVRWVAPLLAPAVRCAAWRGSVWHGQCNGAQVATGAQPLALDLVEWKLQPLALLRLAVAAQVRVTSQAGSGEGRIEVRAGGALSARDVAASWRITPQTASVLPPGWQANIQARGLAVKLAGPTLRELAGEIRLQDIADTRGRKLGSYRLTFPAGSAAPFTGELSDDGGSLEVRAKLIVQADRGWQLDGTVLPRDAAARALESQLAMLGPRDAGGRYRLALSGSFN